MIRIGMLLLMVLAVFACSPKKTSKTSGRDDAAPSSVRAVQEMQPELMVLRQVFVEESSEQGSLLLPAEDMAKQLGATLVTSGFLAARDGDVPETHTARRVEAFLTLSYDWAPSAEPEAGALVLAAEARLEFVDGRSDLAPQVAILMEASVPRLVKEAASAQAAQEALSGLAESATANLAESLVARERLRRAPHAELLSALSVGLKEPSMRIWGLQLAADRGLQEAVPAAIASLATEDEALRAAAISALVALRDPSGVAALVKDVDFNSYEELAVTMEAISAIGGDDAIEFLEFVASGHSDDELRSRAKESLKRLRSVP